MNPYRRASPPEPDDDRSSSREDVIFYALLVIAGALPVIGVVADGARFGAEATIGLILLLLGAVGLLSVVVRRGS